MHRFKSKGVSSRVFPKPQWINPKEKIVHWNIVTGDKVKKKKRKQIYPGKDSTFFLTWFTQVAIIAGKDKDTIGEIKSVNRQTNTVIVEGKKLVKKKDCRERERIQC